MQVARSRSPNHVVAVRLLIRKLGTSNTPTVIRRMISMTSPVERPRQSVAIDQHRMVSGYSTRGWMRSTSQPPGICSGV
jgi:hypothetical protein